MRYSDIKKLSEAEIIKFPGNKKPISNLAVARGGADVVGFPEKINLDGFQEGYVDCALWSSTDDNGNSLYSYNITDIASPTLKQMVQDCDIFRQQNQELLELYHEYGFDEKQAGHDFWLTRNHHGTGFWDREIPKKLGQRLTKAAQKFHELDLYIGDDKMIHSS